MVYIFDISTCAYLSVDSINVMTVAMPNAVVTGCDLKRAYDRIIFPLSENVRG